MSTKSTVEEIRERFDNDVERFSNLETGQSAAIDSPLSLELVARTVATLNRGASDVLDIGCGAGNYTLRLLQELPGLNCTLVDLSAPMLERAKSRVTAAGAGDVTTIQQDIREIELPADRFDVAVAAATLHHLRTDAEWEAVFKSVYGSLKPGGSFWIVDLIEHSNAAVQALMWERYGEYVTSLKGTEYRDHVWAYIAKEDTPRPLIYQLDLLRKVGFAEIEVLHKNSCFACFGGIKQ
jgi:tRNA (cmo5U34)-methyltransferase